MMPFRQCLLSHFCRSSSKSKPRQFTFHPRAASSGSVLLLSEPSANLLLNHLPLYNPTAGLSQADHFFSNWLVTGGRLLSHRLVAASPVLQFRNPETACPAKRE